MRPNPTIILNTPDTLAFEGRPVPFKISCPYSLIKAPCGCYMCHHKNMSLPFPIFK
jgi:hypothetical protein